MNASMAVTDAPQPTGNRAALLGALAGFALGAGDWVVLELIGVEIMWSGYDLGMAVMGVFALTYAALGYAIGRLYEARRRLRHDAAVIERQMEQLASSQARALQFEKLASIGRMAAGVAHEVRNPLAVIRSSAALLAEDETKLDAQGKKACRFIHEEIDRLDEFIRALLDFSRPVTPDPESVAPADLLDRVAVLAGDASNRAGFVVNTDVANGAPARVQVDPDLLTRALLPLVINAGEAAGDGGRVQMTARSTAGALVIDVADDGPGISSEDAERVFDPFVTRKAGGTGLGLPMSDRIARALGGGVELRPDGGLGEGGGGACFRVTVPVAGLAEVRP